ncbi:hypothetical protein ACFX2B_018086 [Malus domestica]
MKFLSQKLLPSSSKFSHKKKFLIVIVLFFYHNVAAVKLPNNEKIPAVIVFGDSVVDSGNNNNISTLVKCNFPPYGRDFVGQRPTGRFGNGRVPSDLIAKLVGVNKILPAYLDPKLKIQDLLTGVSFTSCGSGYDPLTPKIVSVLSLSDQIDMFKTYINKITAAVGKESAATILSKSIYIVCTGSNDIVNTYFSTPLRRPRYDISAYTDLMVESASSFFQELYGLGARRIGVVSLPPIGCLSSQRTLRGGRDRGCLETINQAASLFNSKLSPEVDAFNMRLPEARLVYLDVYNTLLSLIRNPTQYGFEVMDQGCCGTGNIKVSILCTRYSPGTCNDASKYIFWDSYHPSKKGYEVITPMVFDSQTSNSSVKFLSIVIVLFLFHYASGTAVKLPENKKIPAVIVFGNSIVDPGNNNNIKTTVKANFPPYGRDFIERRPTGRFNNGRVPSDFIAESTGVKKILPPYLDPNLSLQDLLTGVSFASGGSGYDPLSSQIVSVLSLSDQLDLFKHYIRRINAAIGNERTAIILSKSIYIVCTGTDDIANTYLLHR